MKGYCRELKVIEQKVGDDLGVCVLNLQVIKKKIKITKPHDCRVM